MHPLLNRSDKLVIDDLQNFPVLSLPDGAFPKIQNHLQSLGFQRSTVGAIRHEVSCWDARLEEMKHQLSAELSPEVVERFDRSIVDLCKSIHHPERVGTAHIYPLITRSCVEKIFEVALDEITD